MRFDEITYILMPAQEEKTETVSDFTPLLVVLACGVMAVKGLINVLLPFATLDKRTQKLYFGQPGTFLKRSLRWKHMFIVRHKK